MMKVVDEVIINDLIQKSYGTTRKRINYKLHELENDPIQRMLNVLQPGTYVRPHKHSKPEKIEIFVIIRGRLLVCIFDEKGNIIKNIILNAEDGNHIVEIPHSTYHTIIALSTNTVVFECKNGPYEPISDKFFAPWAPIETDPNSISYITKILNKLNIIFPHIK